MAQLTTHAIYAPARRARPLVILSLCLLLCGCGANDQVEITGEVTFDGEPVERGQISFVAVDSDLPTGGAVIEDGRYTAQVSPGGKRVEIRGSRPLPQERQSSPEMGLLYEDFVPAAYNENSTLTVEVTAGGNRVHDFHLTLPQTSR